MDPLKLIALRLEAGSTRINKVCKCGKVHDPIPLLVREQLDDDHVIGYYWECECKSTLFLPTYKIGRAI